MGDVEVTEIGESFELTFSEPKEYNMNEDVFYRIYINKETEDGSEIPFVISFRGYYSLGLKHNRKFSTLYFPIDIDKNDKFIEIFEDIKEKCKEHLMKESKTFTPLNGLKQKNLYKLGSCFSNKNGRPPVLYAKVPVEYDTGRIIPHFYEKPKIDGSDKNAKLIEDPYKFRNEECVVNAAVRFESIFIKGDIISLQVKLYEIEISTSGKRQRKPRERKRLLLTGR